MFLCLLLLALPFFLLCCLQAFLHLNGVGFNIPAQLGGMAQLFELFCEEADLLGTGFIAVELLALLYCPPSRIDGQKETRYNGKEGRQRR